jgi:hypothetical protein
MGRVFQQAVRLHFGDKARAECHLNPPGAAERSETDHCRLPRSGKGGTTAVKPACRVVWDLRLTKRT